MQTKQTIRKIAETLHLAPYTRSQKYIVRQRYTVDNKKFSYWVLPLPLNTSSQKVQGRVHLTPTPSLYQKSGVFYNAIYTASSIADNTVFLQTEVRVIPIIYTKKAQYKLTQYPHRHEKKERLHPHINSIVRTVVDREERVLPLLQRLYEYVLEFLIYDNPIEGLYSYQDALAKRHVDCGGFCMLLSALMDAVGIPHRLAVGFLTTKARANNLSMHVWLEVFMPDKTIFPLDPSIDWRRRRGLTSRWGGFGYIGSDRIITSYGHHHTLSINKKQYKIPLFQNPFTV